MQKMIIALSVLSVVIVASGAADAKNKKSDASQSECGWVGPGGRAVYRCTPAS
jgi:hypothetical protein